VTAFGGKDIEKRLWIKFKKTFFLKLARQSITLGDLRKSPFDFVLFREVCGVRVFLRMDFKEDDCCVVFALEKVLYDLQCKKFSSSPHLICQLCLRKI
jgi:hypothetical protein